jgi:putative hydroxymethylpyrimidine transport system substrate-binding protein
LILGPGGPAILSSMIEADGGQCDVSSFVPVNNGFHHVDALANGIADVATLIFENFEIIEAKHRGLDVDFFALKDYGIPDFNQLILISSEECYKKRKIDIKLLINILHRAVQYIYSNPTDAKRIYITSSHCAQDDVVASDCYDATVSRFTTDFSLPDSYYESLNTWMFEKKIIASPLDLNTEKLWTNELITDLK